MKFYKGQKVRLVKGGYGIGESRVGHIFTIKECMNGTNPQYKVEEPGFHSDGSHYEYGCVCEKSFEAYEGSAVAPPKMRFRVGDRVGFKGVEPGDCIPRFFADDVPKDMICHGSSKTHLKDYDARIRYIHNGYYIVRYIGDDERIVQLPFKEEDLVGPKINEPKVDSSAMLKWVDSMKHAGDGTSIKVQKPITRAKRDALEELPMIPIKKR